MTHSQIIRIRKAARERRRGAVDQRVRFERLSFLISAAIILVANALVFFFLTRHLI